MNTEYTQEEVWDIMEKMEKVKFSFQEKQNASQWEKWNLKLLDGLLFGEECTKS